MSVTSFGSSITEVPGVNNAVQKLQELASRMQSAEFDFKDCDVSNVDHIIEALQELEEERAKLHNDLEVETIQASVLRHRLLLLPEQIREEIMAAVSSARQSNADELTRLQQKLEGINKNIDDLEDQHHTLERENAKLHPERDQVRQEHEEIIMQLNQRMAEKAGKQILLNETRDKLRETNQKIVDIEDNIQQLKEDLIVERADMLMEKKRLKKAVFDTSLKIREQKEANLIKKKELDELHEKVVDGEGKLDVIRKSILTYETSRARSEAKGKKLGAQLDSELRQNEQLKKKGEQISAHIAREMYDFEKKKGSFETEAKKLDDEFAKEKIRNKELSAEKKLLSIDLKNKTEIRMSDDSKVKDANEILQKTKNELATKAEDVGRLSQENIDMEARLEELADGHKAIVTTVAKQIEDTRETLVKERKLRMELQGERDAVQKDFDDYKAECNRYLTEMNKKIADGKRQHDELTREGTTLQKTIRGNDDAIRSLKVQVDSESKSYEQKKQHLETDIANLLEEVKKMEQQLSDKQALLSEKMPLFADHEKFFETRTAEYEQMKKNIVAMKNERMSLDDSVKLAQKQQNQMKKPKEELWHSLRRKRGELLQLLHAQGDEKQDIEKKIFDLGCKLDVTLRENDKFVQSNWRFESELTDMQKREQENKAIMDKLEQQLSQVKGDLHQKWAADDALENESSSRDTLLVDDLGILLENTQERGDIIARVSDHLGSELHVLSDFLDNVARRRPTESRQGRKPGSKAAGDKLQLSRPATRLSTKSPAPPSQSEKPNSRAASSLRVVRKEREKTDTDTTQQQRDN